MLPPPGAPRGIHDEGRRSWDACAFLRATLERRDDVVERLARAQRERGLRVVGLVVAADVDGLTLHEDELADDRLFGRPELRRDGAEDRLEFGVFVLGGEGLG